MTDNPKTIRLPPPRAGYPVVTRVISEPLFNTDPVLWALSGNHPMSEGMRIVRMFKTDDGVEVYSTGQEKDGRPRFARETLPWAKLRLVEEVMSLDVLVRELSIAENEEDDEDEEEDEDDVEAEGDADPESGPAPTTSNPA